MRVSYKVAFTSLLILIFSMSIFLSIAIYSIKKKGVEEVAAYKTEELQKIKNKLKSYVDIAYSVIDSNYRHSINHAFLAKEFGARLVNIIDTVESILVSKSDQVRSGRLSLVEAQKQARNEIKKIRYDDGTGYIWINDTTLPFPKMVMHPTIPALDGQILDDPKFDCALGKGQNLFQAFVETVNKSGEGFVDYIWPKPTTKGLIPNVPKLSYVRLFNDWKWIFGTGIYIDDAIQGMVENIKSDIRRMRYDNNTGYFWINDNAKPIPKMVMHPISPQLEDQVLDDPKFNTARGKRENLFKAFLDVTDKYGEGFVDYVWDKPTQKGIIENVPKLSFVRLYEPLGWIIGTGVYIDGIDNEIARKTESVNHQIKTLSIKMILYCLIILVLAISVFYWILRKRPDDSIQSQEAIATPGEKERAEEGFSGQKTEKDSEKNHLRVTTQGPESNVETEEQAFRLGFDLGTYLKDIEKSIDAKISRKVKAATEQICQEIYKLQEAIKKKHS